VDIAPWFENVYRILPGTMGIALGRNPNGIAHELRVNFAPLRRQVPLAAAVVAGVAAVVALRLAEVIDGAIFAGLLLAVPLAGGLLAQRRAEATDAATKAAAREGSDTDGEGPPVPLEWVGIDRPFTPEDRDALDRAIGLSPVEVGR
jgi:branched-chain amino acid transport system permease protein